MTAETTNGGNRRHCVALDQHEGDKKQHFGEHRRARGMGKIDLLWQ
jgi:hypothetical protein